MGIASETWADYRQELDGFIGKRINNPLDAEDLLQDVLLKAFRSQHQVQDTNKVRAWLYQIARHSLIDYYRRKKLNFLALDDWAEVLEAENHFPPEKDSLSACVQSILNNLPEKYQSALIAAEVEEYSQEELGQLWGISYSGAKSRVQRGREQLRQGLERYCGIELTQAQIPCAEMRLCACEC